MFNPIKSFIQEKQAEAKVSVDHARDKFEKVDGDHDGHADLAQIKDDFAALNAELDPVLEKMEKASVESGPVVLSDLAEKKFSEAIGVLTIEADKYLNGADLLVLFHALPRLFAIQKRAMFLAQSAPAILKEAADELTK